MSYRKRLLLASLFFCLALAWTGRFFWAELALRHILLPAVRSQLPGLQVQFQDLDTNLFSRTQLKDLSIDYCSDGDCLHLRAPSLTLSHSLAKILPRHGADSVLQAMAIDLHGAALSAEFSTKGSSSAPSTIILPALPTLPAISISDASLALTVDDSSLDAHGITVLAPSFSAKQAGSYKLDLKADSLKIAGSGIPPQQGSFATKLNYQPGRLEVPSLTFQEALLLDAGLLETDDQGLRFSMNLHLLQSQGLVEGGMDQKELNLSFHLQEGNLQKLVEAAEDSLAPSMLSDSGKSQIRGRLQADGELSMKLARPDDLTGRVTMKMSDGAWNDVPITQLEISARAAEQILNIDTLKCVIDQNQLTVTNGVVPIPELEKKAWLRLLAGSQATAHLRLASPSSLPPAWSEPFLRDWQELGLELAEVDLTLQNNRLRIPQAEVSGQAGHLEIKDAELTLTSDLSAWQQIPVSMRLKIALNDAATVHHFYEDWPATGGEAQAKGTFSGTLARPHLPFEASFTGASISGIALAKVAGTGEWSKDRLALDLAVNNRNQDKLTFKGTIDLDQGGLLTTKISTDIADMQTYLPKSLVGSTAISGPLKATATLSGPFSDLSGTLSASGEWSVRGTKLSPATLDGSFKGHTLSLKHLSMTIDDALRIDAAGRVEPSQDWEHTAIDLNQLTLSYQGQDLNLTSPGGVTISSKAVTVQSPLSFIGPLGRFRLQSKKGKPAGLTLVAEELRDTGLLKKVSGKELGFAEMNFTLGMNGPLSRPNWRWQGNIQGLAADDGPDLSMDGTFDLSYDDVGLQITQCTFANADNSIKLSGQLPLIFKDQQWTALPSPLQLTAKIDLPKGGILTHLFPEWLTTSADVRADLNVSGSIAQPLGTLQFSGIDLKPGPKLSLLPPGPFDSKALLKIEKDRLDVTNFEITSPNLTLQSAGVIDQLPLTALVDNTRDSLPGNLKINGHYTVPALNWLAAKVPALRRTKGSASGSFALRGPLAHPETQASLSMKNGAARGSDSLLVFRDISLEAVLDQEKLSIQSLSGTLGGSPLQISGQANAIFGDAPELALQLSGKDLLLYRADGFKIRADTTITLTGTAKAPQISGEIMLTDSKITKKVDWLAFLKPGTNHRGSVGFSLFPFTEAPLKDTKLNLRLKAAQPLLIANNVFKGGVRPDLLLAGTGEVPYLKGVIYADEGRITLPSGRLDLERGLIRFAENAPDRPQLEFQAGGRMMAYDITAQIRGTYDEPEVTLSSVPPLANEDLLMLLLTGRPPVNAGQTSGNSGVSTVAVYFGRGLLTRLFGEKADQLLLLDRLEVDVGRAVTQQGEPTLDAKIKLAEDVWKANTSYYLTGEKDVWDYYNAGLRAVFHFR